MKNGMITLVLHLKCGFVSSICTPYSITNNTLQPVNLCISKNFMVPPFTDHTKAYTQSILH
jgi:hypothetical protein